MKTIPPGMDDTTYNFHGIPVLQCAKDGPRLATASDAVALIVEAKGHGAHLVIVPVSRFDPGFFSLRTLMAGDIIQKFVQYEQPLVILGDIARFRAESDTYSAFVTECDEGDHVWFVLDWEELESRLRARGALPESG